jgi:tRNA(Ile)-lysidine synthase
MKEFVIVPGLSGPGTELWRPLLNFSKQEILNFAEKNNLEWREDSTNKENNFTRNKIRNQIFPELEKINKNF